MTRINIAGYQYLSYGYAALRGHESFGRGNKRGWGYFTLSYTSIYVSSLYLALSTPGFTLYSISPTISSTVTLASLIFNFDAMDLDLLQGIQPNRMFRGRILFAINTIRKTAGCYLYCRIQGYNQTRYSRFKYYNYKEIDYRI